MPSMEAPNYYDRAKGILPGEFDNFFKYLGSDDLVAETGDVEAALGWVALVKVDSDLIINITAPRAGWSKSPREQVPDEGWYVIRRDGLGFIFAMEYGPDATLNEENARADFAEAEHTYSQWLDLIDEGY